jgi:hypothetical protein
MMLSTSVLLQGIICHVIRRHAGAGGWGRISRPVAILFIFSGCIELNT